MKGRARIMESNILGEVNFTLSARFSQLIGRNLISNPVVAVSELVKNSFDADADNISVIFNGLQTEKSTLSIVDDGEGMSYEDLATKWMTVGTDNKVHSPVSAKGRRKLGEKGIGRFSVERLATRVQIVSSKINDDFAIVLSINWDDYDNFTGDFSELKHQVTRIPFDRAKKGTQIIMESLRDDWSIDRLRDLQKELELLRPINLNKISYKKYFFPGSDVKIVLSAPGILRTRKLIDSKFINFAQAHLYGEIEKDGQATIRINIKPNISASKEEIYEIFTYSDSDKGIDTSCGPVVYEAFVFLKDQRLYRSLDIDKKETDDYLNTFCGMKIYRDGFRILPFGDPDNDWLELNAHRTSSPEFRIATQNVIGIVYITRDENPGLQDVLSRENMYETTEYAALKRFVNMAFEKYTAIQLGARKKKERKIREEGQLALENVQKTVSNISSQVGVLKEAVSKTREAQTTEQKMVHIVDVQEKASVIVSAAEASLENLRSAYSYYKKQTDFKSREMQIYRNIATLGINAAMFGHEALNQTVDSKAILNDVFADFSTVISTAEGLEHQLKNLHRDLVLIDEKANFFRNYLSKEKQDRSRYLNLYKILVSIIGQHKNAFSAINVEPTVEIQGKEDQFIFWGYEGDIDTIFTNLITNAYKALKKATDRKIFTFSLEKQGETIVIHVRNSGKIIAEDDRGRIFEPLFSTYSDGTGLGLTITQDTINSYQGTINLEKDFPETHFVIRMPCHKANEGE